MNNDALLEYLTQMGVLQQEDAGLQRRRARIDALRQGGSPARGQMISGHYVSADPLQHLSNAIGEGMAGYQETKLEQDELDLAKRRGGMLGGMRKRPTPGAGMVDRSAPGWHMTPEL